MHLVVTLTQTVAQTTTQTEDDWFGLQAGPYAFIVFVALGLALVFLLLSMRKQIRRVDFDASGTTDAERMRPRGSVSNPDDDGT